MNKTAEELVAGFSGQALNYVIILKEVENENETDFGFDKSGLVDKNEKYKRGVVVSMGAMCPKDEKMTFRQILKKLISLDFDFKKPKTIKVSDTILYDGYKSSPLSVDGEEYKTIMYADMVMSF